MNKVRAIITGVLVWTVAVTVFSISFFIPVMEDLELQANLMLALFLAPTVSVATGLFYLNGATMHGLTFASIALGTGVVLDATITVPFLIMPYGGSYTSFFGGIEFWLIVAEYYLVSVGYWYFKVNKQSKLALK